MKHTQAILIFGAGVNQLELIREAKKLGLISVVIDPQENPPGSKEADFFYQVEGSDYEKTKEIAVSHNIAGIVTGQMEKPLRLMATLAEGMEFIFNSKEVTERCIDKWLMKQAFVNSNVPCATAVLVKSDEEALNKIHAKISFPLIIKPRDAYSSRGVYRCESAEDIKEHIRETREYASNGDILIEEFLEGREFSIEAVTYNGKTTIIQVTEKLITPYPCTVETGHLQPADIDPDQREEISIVAIHALTSLGIENSASHTEIMLTGKGPRVIETGARLGGDFISSYLTRASTGISMDRAAIQVALGKRPDLIPSRSKYSMIKYIDLPVGRTVSRVKPFEDMMKLPGVVFAWIFLKAGDITEPLRHSAHRPGCILAEADDKETLITYIEKYSRMLSEKIVLI